MKAMTLVKCYAVVGLFAGIVGNVVLLVKLSTPSAHAAKYQDDHPMVQVNPNPARVLNRTKVRIGGYHYEQVTTENVPGLVCVTTVSERAGLDTSRPTTSCVRY